MDDEKDYELREELREKYTDESGSFDSERMKSDLGAAKRFMFRLYLLMSAAFILAGLAFAFIGALGLFSQARDKMVCTERTEGVVLGFDSMHSDSDDPSSSLVYAPIFSYTYDGMTYTHRGSSYSDSKGKLSRGSEVTVYVDPDDPTRVYIPEYTVEKRNSVLFLIVGLALSGGFLGYVLYKRREFNRSIDRLIGNDTT
ncbi:MAG: DUF3592 domain-containing protein [Ruminococcus sp.]|nr:DUF3592 domain-containing protein [Ruminococcus sp.]